MQYCPACDKETIYNCGHPKCRIKEPQMPTATEIYNKYCEDHGGSNICVNLFGYTANQILLALDWYEKNKETKGNQMIREEAMIKVRAIFHSSISEREMSDFVDALEALGLIKFDNEPVDPDAYLYKYGITKSNLKILRDAGYDIFSKQYVRAFGRD